MLFLKDTMNPEISTEFSGVLFLGRNILPTVKKNALMLDKVEQWFLILSAKEQENRST